MKALILTLALFTSAYSLVLAQGKKSVVIGTFIDKPNAILVINPPNSDQGFLLPQLTTAQRVSIVPSSPQDDGLLVFDITDKSFYYWSGDAWIKGLGDNDSQVLSYNAVTQTLSLSNSGGQVDLSTLKEIPTPVGNAGKFLTTDGTTLSWVTIAAFGDITGIAPGQGLTGGGTSGDVSLSVSTDGTTIGFTGTDQLQLLDNAVTPSKIASVGNDKVLTTNAGGTVTWANRSTFTDAQNLGLAANTLTITNGTSANLNTLTASGQVNGPLNNLAVAANSIDATHINADAVQSSELADNAVDANAIQSAAVTLSKILPGANNQVLVTDGVGSVQWVNQTSLTNVAVDGITITGNGGVTPLTVGSIAGSNIANGSVQSIDIEDSGISTIDLANGAVDVNKLGNDAVTSAKVLDGSILSNDIQDGTIASVDILDETISSVDILNGTIANADLAAGSVNVGNIISGGNNRVLTTDGTGSVTWIDRNTFTDAQTLALSGANILDISNGNAVDLNAVNATGPQIQGRIDALAIVDGTVTSADVQDNSITSGDILNATITNADLALGSVDIGNIVSGGNGKVLTTNGVGVVAWVDRTTFTDAQTLGLSAANILDISNGNSVDLNTVNATGPQIQGTIAALAIVDGTVTNADLANNSVNSNTIVDNTVSSADITDGTVNTIDVANAAIDGNKLANNSVASNHIVDNSVASADISDNSITSADILNATIANADLALGSVDVGNIVSGGNGKVLTTNGAGTVAWADRTTFTDAQTLGLSAANI
ncbi:MAG: hypothetical protein ABI663_21330, partial [Chryseolinea sp.]